MTVVTLEVAQRGDGGARHVDETLRGAVIERHATIIAALVPPVTRYDPPMSVPAAASALSGHLDTRTAATEVAHELHDALAGPCDLVFIFASFHHRAALPEAVETIRQTIAPGTTLAVTTEGVLGDESEREGLVGMSGLAMRLPGARLTPWMSTPQDPIPLRDPAAIAQRINLTHDLRATFMIGDPFSTPITRLLPALSTCGGADHPVPVVGGMASGASQAGYNVMVLDDRVFSSGAIGVSVAGEVDIRCVVSQGCRPIGKPLVVTRAESNQVFELGGKPALTALQEMTTALDERERELLGKGLLMGSVIDERNRPFGRGDFLVRNLVGLEKEKGAILVGDLPRIGQTVQFHVRDAQTAAEDLQLLLDAEVIEERPFGSLLFTCNGRGRRLFGTADHDIGIINDRLGPLPMAGFFAAGEIGPVGARSFLHGHTAALALFRRRDGA